MSRSREQAREDLEHEIQKAVFRRARALAIGKPNDAQLRAAVAEVCADVLAEHEGLLPPPRITVLTCLEGSRVTIRASVESPPPAGRPGRVVPFRRK